MQEQVSDEGIEKKGAENRTLGDSVVSSALVRVLSGFVSNV